MCSVWPEKIGVEGRGFLGHTEKFALYLGAKGSHLMVVYLYLSFCKSSDTLRTAFRVLAIALENSLESRSEAGKPGKAPMPQPR